MRICVAIGAVSPTATMRCTSRSFIGCLPSKYRRLPRSTLLLSCKIRANSMGTGQRAAVNGRWLPPAPERRTARPSAVPVPVGEIPGVVVPATELGHELVLQRCDAKPSHDGD